ncbi:MAG: 50S ribosomal protein L10, partial [Archaeoglobaceae archaeon]
MAAVRGAPARWKIETVEEIKNLISKKPVLAIVSFRGVPANQMQNIRRNIRNEGTFKVVKNNLLKRALEELGGK